MGTAGSTSDRADPSWVHRALGVAAVAALGAVVVLALLGLVTGRLVVVGDTVVRPGPAGGVLIGVAALLGVARRQLGRRAPDAGVRARGPSRAGVVVLAVVATVSAGLSWLGDVTSTHHVLSPTGPDGCRVVVEERSFLFAGGGTVQVLPRFALLTRVVGRYDADDGYTPFTAGTWSLTWSGDRATLHLSGNGVDPVWPADQEVSCSG